MRIALEENDDDQSRMDKGVVATVVTCLRLVCVLASVCLASCASARTGQATTITIRDVEGRCWDLVVGPGAANTALPVRAVLAVVCEGPHHTP